MVKANNNRIEVLVDDSSSPFHLHNGEHPSLSLISEILVGSNYNSWSRSLMTALKARNKVPFIDGSLPAPDSTDLLFGAWERCNSTVIAWLRNTVDSEIGRSLLYFNTAAEIWRDLYDRFAQGNAPRIFQLRQELAMLKQGELDVNGYFTKMRILWDEYKDYQVMDGCTYGMNCGNAKSWNHFFQRECVMQFLMGLHESFIPIRGQILLLDPLPNISKVFSLVLQEERQRSIGTVGLSNPVSEFSTTNAAQGNRFQFPRGKERPICSHYGRSNHTIDTCYEIHGFPPGFGRGRGRGKNFGGQGRGQVHQTSAPYKLDESIGTDSVNVHAASPNLSVQQCQQLLSYLNTQLNKGQSSVAAVVPDSTDQPSASCFSGTFSGAADWDG